MFVVGPEKLKIEDNIIDVVNLNKSSIFIKLDFRSLKLKLIFLLDVGEFSVRVN